jgi:hypothetical protein
MLELDKTLERRVAKMPTPHTWVAKIMEQPREVSDRMEWKLEDWLMEQAKTLEPSLTEEEADRVARLLRDPIPLLLEREALQMLVEEEPQWMEYLPEILSPEEGVALGMGDVMYVSQKEEKVATELLNLLEQGALTPPLTSMQK